MSDDDYNDYNEYRFLSILVICLTIIVIACIFEYGGNGWLSHTLKSIFIL